MRSKVRSLAVAVAGILLVPQLAAATKSDVEEQLELMADRMSQLEDQLQATNDKLDTAERRVEEQQVQLEAAGLEEERGARSKLSAFIADTEFSGALAASYFYNINKPGFNAGGNTLSLLPPPLGPAWGNPFHPNHNTFEFDEFSLSMGRAADDNNRAGFQVDLFFGETAEVNSGTFNGGGNAIWVRQAYIEYKTGWFKVTGGKFDTHIGYETVGAAENVNVTRSLVYSQLQPVSQIGFKVGDDYDSGLYWMLGATNGLAELQPDIDSAKDFIWSLGWGDDTLSLGFNGEFSWYSNEAIANPDGGFLVLDLVTEWTPSDDIVAWLNFTYNQQFPAPNMNPYALGVSVGSRIGVTDDMGVALRFDYLYADDDDGIADDGNFIALTGTFDYALTDALTAKIELRWDRALDIMGAPTLIFPCTQSRCSFAFSEDRVLIGGQLVYAF